MVLDFVLHTHQTIRWEDQHYHDVFYPLAVERNGAVGVQLLIAQEQLVSHVFGNQLRLTYKHNIRTLVSRCAAFVDSIRQNKLVGLEWVLVLCPTPDVVIRRDAPMQPRI